MHTHSGTAGARAGTHHRPRGPQGGHRRGRRRRARGPCRPRQPSTRSTACEQTGSRNSLWCSWAAQRATLTVIAAGPAAPRLLLAAAPRLWPPTPPAPRASAVARPERECRRMGAVSQPQNAALTRRRRRRQGCVIRSAHLLACSSAMRCSSHSRLPGRGAMAMLPTGPCYLQGYATANIGGRWSVTRGPCSVLALLGSSEQQVES